MFIGLKLIDKRIPAAGLRLSNIIGNILDILVLPFLFLGIGLLSFSFTFSFSPVPLHQAASAIGLQPLGFVSEQLVADLQEASVATLLNAPLIVLPLIVFVWLRHRILTPLARRDFVLLLLVASPLPLSLLVGALGLKLCIFPLAEMSSSGAVIMGEPKDSFHFCEPLIEGDTWAATAYGAFRGLYAIALIPLNLAALSSIGLTALWIGKATGFRLRSAAWPLRWLRNLIPAVFARASQRELRSVLWLLLVAVAVPAVALLSLLPPISTAEIDTVLAFLPMQYRDGPIADLFVGVYAGPGRQLLLLVLIMTIWLMASRKWLTALIILLSSLLFPFLIYYLMTNYYLSMASSNHIIVFLLFIFLAGWTAYIVSFQHWRRLLDLLLSVFALASNRASKDVRRFDDPIVYLRPFALDSLSVPTLPSVALRLAATQARFRPIEACIADAAFKFAPLVALGDKEVVAEPVGAVREYTSNDQWKGRISELLTSPRAVLFLVGATSATKWEVETIVSNDLLMKTVFILPPEPEVVRQFFVENDILLKHFQIEESELIDGVARGWLALWSDQRKVIKKFIAGKADELAYKLAVARALAEID